MQPHRQQPTRLPCPWDSPGKNTGVGCHFLLQWVKVKLFSWVWLLATPWSADHQAPLSMGFSRQEDWSGVPLPSPEPQLSGTKSCFFVHLREWQMAASCIPLAPQQSLRGVAASAGSKFWEPSFTFGGQKLLMVVTFLVYWYGRKYFHITVLNLEALDYKAAERRANEKQTKNPTPLTLA